MLAASVIGIFFIPVTFYVVEKFSQRWKKDKEPPTEPLPRREGETHNKAWSFTPCVKAGEKVSPGQIIG
jgi:hypothetical protein